MKKQEDKNIELVEENIDLRVFLKKIWNKRYLILKICSISVFLGCTYVLFAPKVYKATTVFVSQEDEITPSGSLGGLASLAGINLGSLSSENAIPPKLYPGIVYSTPFLSELLEVEVPYGDGSIDYKHYLEMRSKQWYNVAKEYTIGLPGVILKSLRGSKESNSELLVDSSVINITDEDFEFIEDLEDLIAINVNEKDGDISLSFKDNDPFVAAQMASYATNLLQQKVIDYKTIKASELHKYLQVQFFEKRNELYQAQDSLAIFIEENKNLSSALVLNKRLRLESSLDMLSAVYNELGAQNEQAALQLKKQTPIFSIIEPVRVPNKKSSPRLSIVGVGALVFGLLLSIGVIFLREPLSELKTYLKNS